MTLVSTAYIFSVVHVMTLFVYFFCCFFLLWSMKVPVFLRPSLSDEVPILFSEVDEDADAEADADEDEDADADAGGSSSSSNEEPDSDSIPRMWFSSSVSLHCSV